MTAAANEIQYGTVAALCGGVGGAKLAFGLQGVVRGESLAVIVNTGDDFEHLGLSICPDIDTVLYTLGGLNSRARGWGREDESWSCMETLATLGGESWFQLGDRDLALHLLRSDALRSGQTLSDITSRLATALGIDASVIPMSDDPVHTIVHTDAGELPFQRYFVEQRCEPRLRRLRFAGAESATPAPGAIRALARTDLAAVLICPSNPYLSIDPILAVAGIRDLLAATPAPIVAVSPIVAGAAVKGPTAKIMTELGVPVSSLSVAEHYRGLIDAIVIDRSDRAERHAIESLGIAVHVTDTLMRDDADKSRLARETLDFAAELQPKRHTAVS
jgi:LPPG:FO 2-phospho-L-lactate transferase